MHNQKAFTLLECIVYVVISIIILLFVTQNFSERHKIQQATLIAKELQHIVNTTRGLALSTRRSLVLCGSADGNYCNNAWSKGILLFEDTDHDGQFNNAEHSIKYTPLALKHAHLSWNGFSGQFMRFESLGITAASNGTFTYCQIDNDPRFSRQVIVSRGGRARLSQDKNGDGYHEDVSGTPQINCL